MPSIDGTPKSIRVRAEFSTGIYTDITVYCPRDQIKIDPAEPGVPRRLTLLIKKKAAGLSIREGLHLLLDVTDDPASAYPRIYGGYIVDMDEASNGSNEEWQVTLLCYNSLLTRGSNQIEDEVDIGGFDIFQINHAYTATDLKVVPIANNDHYYKCTTPGTSAGTEGPWNTGAGSTTTQGTAVFTEVGRPTRTDKQAVEYILGNYLPEIEQLFITEHTPNLPLITIGWETVESALGKIAAQSSSFSYPLWQASHVYTGGELIRAVPPNDFYYENTTPGTTAASPPGSWTTVIGGTVTSGTTVFTCRGSTVVAPFLNVTVTSDNTPHTALWQRQAHWLDITSRTEVPLLSIEWIDTTVEGANQYRTDTRPKRRRESGQYRNKQTVQGSVNAKATVTDSGQVTYYGRTVTGPVVKDDSLDTNAKCTNAAWVILGALGAARETISFTSLKMPTGYTPRNFLQGVFRVKFTNAKMGISQAEYFATVGLSFGSDGIAKWSWQLGTTPQTLGQNGLPRALGGARGIGDFAAPGPPQWPAGSGWLLQNNLNAQTFLVDIVVTWLPPLYGNGDLAGYDVYYKQGFETYWHRSARQPAGTLSLPVTVQPGTTSAYDTSFYVRAIDTHDNNSVPSTTKVAPHVAMPDPPPAPTITGATSGVEGRTTYWADVVIDHPTGDHSRGGYLAAFVHGAPHLFASADIPPNATYPYTARIHNVALGEHYDFKSAVCDTYAQWSLEGSLLNFLITSTPPHEPVITNPIAAGGSGLNGYIARPVISKFAGGDDASGGAWLYWAATSGATDRPGYSLHIPAGSSFPFRAYVDGLEYERQYAFTAYIIDQFGQWSNVSPTVNFTAGHVPRKDTPPEGFAWTHPDDDLRGLVLAAGSASEVSFADGVTEPSHVPYGDGGTTSLKLTNGSGGNTAVRGPKIWCAPSVIPGSLGAARMRTGGLGTSPNGALKYQYYTEDDATTGAEQTVFDAIPTTSFVYTEVQMAAAPSDAKYFRWLEQDWDVGGHGVGYSIYFSYPRFMRLQDNKQLAAGAVDGPKIASLVTLTNQQIDLTSTSKLTAGSKVTMDANGMRFDGTGSGAGAGDYYNEVGVRIGRIYSSGASGDGNMVITADYNGAGTTSLTMSGQDAVSLSTTTGSNLLQMTNSGIQLSTSSSTGISFSTDAASKPIKFNTGSVVLSAAALATNATDGFTYIPTCAGTPTGTPTAQTGTAAMVWDSSGKKLYVWNGASWAVMN